MPEVELAMAGEMCSTALGPERGRSATILDRQSDGQGDCARWREIQQRQRCTWRKFSPRQCKIHEEKVAHLCKTGGRLISLSMATLVPGLALERIESHLERS